jgi:hypothetical protein
VICLGILMVLGLISTGCRVFDPEYEARTSEADQVRLIADSEQVQGLVSREEAMELDERASANRFRKEEIGLGQQNRSHELDELRKHRETYIAGRLAFLDAMARERAISIPPGSYCRIIQRSHAICSRHPQENPEFVKVRITSGAA